VLHRGVCVQCDAPERLFRRPRTRFVAAFFRGCNVLTAELATVAGRTDLRIAGASVAAAAAAPAAAGAATLAIRAENVHLGARAARCPTRLAATLEEVVYRGTNVDHLMRLADGQFLVATSTRREIDGAPPQAVTAGVDADDIILLED
jgi:ABC-type Fe3+/spermidine/putrescine transport system ATPase subunit